MIRTILREPPFRQLSAAYVRHFAKSVRDRELWDASERPQYLTGILRAADQAKYERQEAICCIEFGVASGRGLVAMKDTARSVQEQTGIEIHTFGFDTGKGLFAPSGGFKDHPDRWQVGDFPMQDEGQLRRLLGEDVGLILGDVDHTVDAFVASDQPAPIGFVAFDMDYYSSTVSALRLFSNSDRNTLAHVPLYFDDTLFFGASDFAGELLAIKEFNEKDLPIKISPWTVLKHHRPFPERQWLSAMYVATNFERVEEIAGGREQPTVLPL